MTRQLQSIADPEAEKLLNVLVDERTDFAGYRNAMYQIGLRLGREVASSLPKNAQRVLVVCTVEDADFLAQGILEVIERKVPGVRVACFWNERTVPFGRKDLESAPIVRRYEEETASALDSLIVVKSIISGACVVKTNLLDVIQRKSPNQICIVAPVMYAGSEKKLREEFSAPIVRRFKFFTFAIDDAREKDGTIRPGIGGEVYSRLGFGDAESKNRMTPTLVKKRRSTVLDSAVA